MMLSCETRWFWKDEAPAGLLEWFSDSAVHGCAPGGGVPGRQDIYLKGDDRCELGIKVRGKADKANTGGTVVPDVGDVEIKGLIRVDMSVLPRGPFKGPVELWCKWPFSHLSLVGNEKYLVDKRRWLRKFDTGGDDPREIPLGKDERPIDAKDAACLPSRGCNVELTEILLYDGKERWSSMCFEAFGDDRTVSSDLQTVAGVLSQKGSMPDIQGGEHLNYPQWLAKHVRAT